MANLRDSFYDFDSYDNPIDLIEAMADELSWEFDRLNNDQIAMAIQGRWYCYSVTLAWDNCQSSLRLVCSFSLEPTLEKISALHALLNLVNDQCWHGAFTFWDEQQLVVWRYALALEGCDGASLGQVQQSIRVAIETCEMFYPSFHSIGFADVTPVQAFHMAIKQDYGNA